MGVMKGSPATRRAPRGGAGASGSGGPPRGVARLGSGGLPGGDGGGDRKGCLLDGAAVPAAGLPKATEVDGCTAVPRATPRKPAEGRIGSATSSTGPEGLSGGDEGGRGCKILGGPGADAAAHLGDGNQDPGPFSSFLMLCTNCEDEGFAEYEYKIEALGGKAVSGFYYSSATHIVLEGTIPPGARVIWEGDGKIVTTTDWINSCFKERTLLPNPVKGLTENLLPTNDVTPSAKMSPSSRKCKSTAKKSMKHNSRKKSRTPRRLDFSGHSSNFHRHLTCVAETEKTELLYDYALRYRLHEYSDLPGVEDIIRCEDDGINITVPRRLKLLKLSTKVIVTRCFNRVASLQAEGFSMGGHYSSRNFRINSDLSIKLDGLDVDDIVAYTDEAGNMDYMQFVKMIKEEVFLGQEIPFDLTEWLRIIAQGVAACNRQLLCHHVDLMEPYQAYGHFVIMYQIFWSVKGTSGWADLMGSLGHYDGWVYEGFECTFIQETQKHTDLNIGQHVKYEGDIRGLLRVLNNAFKHRGKRYQSVAVYIIMNEFRGLLSDLQRALHQGGYLSHLGW